MPVEPHLSSPRGRLRPALETGGPYLLLALALAFLCWFVLTGISHPGLQYDETLFVNAALGAHFPDQSFISARFHGVPTMVMPYIGALKSWLYAPVFGLLGVSAESIRVPAVLVALGSVCVAFALARRLFGAWIAVLLAVLMATDPAFMAMARLDFGPVAISGLLRVVALAAYFGWLRTGSARYAWTLVGALGLGVFNKLDFALFAVALAVTAAVVHRRRILALVRRRPVASALQALALGVGSAVAYAKIYVPSHALPVQKSGAGFPGRLGEVWDLVRTTLDGSAPYSLLTGEPLPHATAFGPIVVGLIVVAAGGLAWQALRGRGESLEPDGDPGLDSARTVGFFLLLLVLMVAEFVAAPQVVGPHHALLLWPLPALLAVSLVAAALRLDARRPRAAATAFLGLALLVLAATQVRAASEYRAAFASDRAWRDVWTTEIYPLERAVQDASPGADAVLVADWGIGNQLMALGDDALRERLIDLWPWFAEGPQSRVDASGGATIRGRRVILVLHSPAAEVMPGTNRRAAAMLRRLAPARGIEPLYRGGVLRAFVVDDREADRPAAAPG